MSSFFHRGSVHDGSTVLVLLADYMALGPPIHWIIFVVGVIGLIEGILYLTKTDDEFVATYVVGRKGWF